MRESLFERAAQVNYLRGKFLYGTIRRGEREPQFRFYKSDTLAGQYGANIQHQQHKYASPSPDERQSGRHNDCTLNKV
ncbi:MAG TPA: hypothetical protein VF762_19520 [Blastocatellia bacterium]|jgi:hypothetical protein